VLCFRDITSNILREHHANVQLGDEKTQIIKTALKLICNDISTVDLNTKSCPTAHSMTDIPSELALVPESLHMLLRPIVKTDERVAIWEQNFIKACQPRSGVLPYQMGFAIQLDLRFGSKWMLNKLNQLGYTESYAEIQNKKNTAFLMTGMELASLMLLVSLVPSSKKLMTRLTRLSSTSNLVIYQLMQHPVRVKHRLTIKWSPWRLKMQVVRWSPWRLEMQVQSLQFVGDNKDWNIVSIYGNTPFHSMGLIKVTTPEPPSADDCISAAASRVKIKALDKAKI